MGLIFLLQRNLLLQTVQNLHLKIVQAATESRGLSANVGNPYKQFWVWHFRTASPFLTFSPEMLYLYQTRVSHDSSRIYQLKLHSHQTPDQPPLIPDQFLWLGRVWSGKKLPALIEERIYPRSTPAVSALYPWCTHAQIPLFPTYTRPSGWPIPALYDQPPTYSWCNHAHYAQYRTNPRSGFHSRPQMNNSSKCNAGFSTRNAHMAHIVK